MKDKPGKKILPRAAPRRNVRRKNAPLEPSESNVTTENTVEAQHDDTNVDAVDIRTETPQDEHTQGEMNIQTSIENSLLTTRSAGDPDGPSLPLRIDVTAEVAPINPLRDDAPETRPDDSTRGDDSAITHEVSIVTPPVTTARGARAQALREKRGRKRPASSDEATTEASTFETNLLTQDLADTQANIGNDEDSVRPADPLTRSSKRIKASLMEKANPTQSQDTITASPSVTVPRSPSVRSTSQSQPPADLLESATRRAASVSELANSIESHTRSLRVPSEANIVPNHTTEHGAVASQTPSRKAPRPKRKGRKKTVQEQAMEVVANAVGSSDPKSYKRALTPEDAADYELKPDSVKMGDLCQDSKLGRKSALETEMQANWAEILQRRKEDRERAVANAERHRRKAMGREMRAELPEEPVAALAPAMTVVNGVIVVDQSSREIDRGAQLQQVIADNVNNIREDKDYYKYVNQGTVGMKPGRGAHAKWDTEATERFFKGLRMFGTDFLMISNMFPGVTRKQIKMKFIREEKADKAKVLEYLRNREPVELEDYAHMANKEAEEFQTLDSIEKELEEQEKQLREEDNQRRKREGFVTNNGEVNEQSAVEDGHEDGAEGQTESAEPGRFDSVARDIMEAAVAPKKRQRKSNVTSSKRGPKHGRRPEGGIEEVLGSITEVAV